MVNLRIEVGGAIVEDAEVGALTFFFFVHLLCHAGLYLLSGGIVALDGTLETKVEWGIDFDGNIDGVLEARLEKECALLDNDGCVLLQGPLEEVLTDNGMDDAVDAFGVALIGEEVAGDEGFVESAGCVGFSADEFAQLLTDDGAFGHEAFGFVVALIDGYASLLEQLADIGLAAADASCDADACH